MKDAEDDSTEGRINSVLRDYRQEVTQGFNALREEGLVGGLTETTSAWQSSSSVVDDTQTDPNVPGFVPNSTETAGNDDMVSLDDSFTIDDQFGSISSQDMLGDSDSLN